MPKVSVLIPVYNAELHLEKCINSVLAQDFKDIEVIVINDGSLDSSLDIIEKFSTDDRVRIINKSNSGYGASLNVGLKEAKGEYISIVEADDFVEKNMLSTLYSDDKHDVIKGGFTFYPQRKKYNINCNNIVTIEDNPEIINCKPSVWSAIYKKSFLEKNKIQFNETKGASYQDVSFHFKTLFLASSIKCVDIPLYNYRTDNLNSSVKSKNKVQAIIREFESIYGFLENKTLLPEVYAQLILFELRAYIWNYKRISKFYEKEFIFLSKDKLNLRKLNFFYNSKYIRIKDKIKLYLYLNHTFVFMFLLNIIKNYVNKNTQHIIN